jgi:GTPase
MVEEAPQAAPVTRCGFVALIGAPNAGKSTLLNALTHSDVVAEDKLFATLDPTSRRLRFPEEREVIITDTVGFIRDLPPDLVNAFRATLEELDDASLLLHVVDASDPAHDAQVEAVEQILDTLGLLSKPRILVWNKSDRLDPELARTLVRTRGGVAISAATGEGLEALLHKADRTLFAEGGSVELGALVAPLRRPEPEQALDAPQPGAAAAVGR